MSLTENVASIIKRARKGKKGKSDAKYFTTTKKGEIHELRSDLNSVDKAKIKEAVKKVIAAMTVGKDVSVLFADIIKSMGTDDIELKKLVYLYIINYARSQPEKAILVVNTFQKDARSHPNPLVRALAIRTMGCIRVDRITEYLCDPLSNALTDRDPYVRKTAAVCTAKLFDINAELVQERGFVDQLRNLISDSNPMVVANAVAALAEISQNSGKDMFHINSATLQKLLTALNECSEWGQVFILDALANYDASASEAEQICERVTPRLQHANSAVVMSAIKVIMKFLDVIKDQGIERTLTKKLAPPLVTLLSAQPEVQYVALRNINLIVQHRPEILQNEIRVFFCKYNDAPYVKIEKLEIMIQLASERNIDQVLMEFKEYAQEVDVEFVRKAVRAIGRCAIKLENAAERCINVLLELIKTKVNYVVQEAVVVIKDIFRRYPNRYERVIVDLCENLETLDEPEAKASMIWIIGEYADRIEDAPDRLEFFIEAFLDETTAVQLQILTATVKLFLKRPEDAKDMVTQILNLATENSDNPDLRDRGYVYWRLLSTDPAAAKAVVLAERPVISDDTYRLEGTLLNTLIANISTLSSVYHKPPETFVKGISGSTVFKSNKEDQDESDEYTESSSEEESESDEGSDEEESEDEEEVTRGAPSGPVDILGDLMGGMDVSPSSQPSTDATITALPAPHEVLSFDKGHNLALKLRYTSTNNQPFLEFMICNSGAAPISNAALRFNKNYIGLVPGPLQLRAPVPPNRGTGMARCPIRISDPIAQAQPFSNVVQIAIKTDLGVAYFQDRFPTQLLFTPDGHVEKVQFLQIWKGLATVSEQAKDITGVATRDYDHIAQVFATTNVFFVVKRQVAGKGDLLYMAAKLNGVQILFELTFAGTGVVKAVAKSEDAYLSTAALEAVACMLTNRH